MKQDVPYVRPGLKMIAIAFVMVCLLTPLATSSAHASATPAMAEQHCEILLAKLLPGETTSRVLSQHCAAREQDLAPLSGTLIMTWYNDANYLGSSTSVRVSDACDSLGWGISDVGTWTKISSFKTWNLCNTVAAFTNTNYGGTECGFWSSPGSFSNPALQVSYVGSACNDKMRSFLLREE
ncbi:MAG TPA: hypothetical protein VFN35_16245 [Ktedonobacteraceae bacterium]|nr:hypothetical protein [Ktedonobacteraceae bacterium]